MAQSNPLNEVTHMEPLAISLAPSLNEQQVIANIYQLSTYFT